MPAFVTGSLSVVVDGLEADSGIGKPKDRKYPLHFITSSLILLTYVHILRQVGNAVLVVLPHISGSKGFQKKLLVYTRGCTIY